MKGMTATRKIIQTTVSKIKNAVLGVPGTAFFHFLSQDIWPWRGYPSHHQTQELFFLKRALMVWFAFTPLNA
jgi:hypothetical protein